MERADPRMEQAVRTMLGDLERSGPEGVGAPVRAVAVLACDVGDLFPATSDPLARRRRRASAARLARRAVGLAAPLHGVVAHRPPPPRARAVERRAPPGAVGQRPPRPG